MSTDEAETLATANSRAVKRDRDAVDIADSSGGGRSLLSRLQRRLQNFSTSLVGPETMKWSCRWTIVSGRP